jgi:hypothetical protein
MRNLYQVLGVAPGAADEQLKDAFHSLAKTFHPDLNSGNRQAELRFIEVSKAYAILSDPKARSAYDQGLADQRTDARRRVGKAAMMGFATSMLSTVVISLMMIWLLTDGKLVLPSGTDRDATQRKESVSASPAPHEKTTHAQEKSPLGQTDSGEKAGVEQVKVQDSQPPTDPLASLAPCNALLAEQESGILRIMLVDQHRARSSITVKVDDLHYRGTFAADGRLTLAVPSLSDTPILQWALADGTPCRQVATVVRSGQLRVALVWAGNADLQMHVIEPNSWLGSPVGHISSDKPNLDGSDGAGLFRTFGLPGDSFRVQLFVVDPARLGDRRFLNALVVHNPAAERRCVGIGQASEVRYEVHIQGSRRSELRHREVRSMAFQLAGCGEPESNQARSENILVRF